MGVEIRSTEPQHQSAVRITPAPLARLAMPSDRELDDLLGIVLERWSQQLRPRPDHHDFRVEFTAAFRRLLHIGRLDRMDESRSLSWWLDDCRQFLRDHGGSPASITGPAYMAAVCAHGDILYAPLDNFPFDLGFGLQFGGGGRPSCAEWKRVLAAGRLREPTSLSRPAVPISPARVSQLAMNVR